LLLASGFLNNPPSMSLHPIDYAIIALYFVFVLGIGWAL
jgi:hypothetical protein